MPKTIRELADEFGVSKQAIRKKLDENFRANYVRTVTRNGVQTLVVTDSGYLLLKQHFNSGNNHKSGKKLFTSNAGSKGADTIELLKEQLSIKDKQIKEKDDQLKAMQKLLDQSQQLQLIAEKRIEKFNTIPTIEKKSLDSKLKNNKVWKLKNKFWWPFRKQ
jgi:DNA-binding transcriptional MerR regulator